MEPLTGDQLSSWWWILFESSPPKIIKKRGLPVGTVHWYYQHWKSDRTGLFSGLIEWDSYKSADIFPSNMIESTWKSLVVWCWSLSPAASPLASLEEGDCCHAGAQKRHLLKIKDFHWPLMEWGRGWGVWKGSPAWAIWVHRNQRNQGKLQICFHV